MVLSLNDEAIEGGIMGSVKISSKYQVVIPEEVRNTLGLKPGQRMEVITYNGRIEMVPVGTAEEMKGFVKGIDTSVPRDKDRL
jgi:AbrB family looped-hinge helix DNA binding protein